MGRHNGPKCRLCRREGVQLFLKGERCVGAKCGVQKRPKPPGVHSWRRGKISDYGIRLREKQKCKRYYGVFERQFRGYYEMATSEKGDSGANLLRLLERRLDNVLTVSGFAVSRSEARQTIRHGHVTINGKRMDVPSFLVEEGDIIRPVGTESILTRIRENREVMGKPTPAWVEINEAEPSLRVMRMPNRDDVTVEVNEQYIVEFCAR